MDKQMEKASLCALGKIFGFEPKIATALITHAGSASGVFGFGKDELEQILGPYSTYRWQIRPEAVDSAGEELLSLQEKGIWFCGWTEDDYPSILKECPDPPVGIYIRSGSAPGELWNPERKIAIIGTRDISSYGREWCEKIVLGLEACKEKPLIISGLALGTDICAHRTALEAGLPTIGVMATGPESIYPHRNTQTAMQMIQTPGCGLITDYPPGTAPLAIHFLRRNRIIAGLAQATILVESRIRGGGMMTARLAFSYDRDVYALPGRADDIFSQGCNDLIRNKIAEPITSVSELIESLGMKEGKKEKKMSVRERVMNTYGRNMPLEKAEKICALLETIRKERGISIEELSHACGLPFHHAVNICGLLESDGLITIDLLQRCSINAKSF
jgi:DNA processing protein